MISEPKTRFTVIITQLWINHKTWKWKNKEDVLLMFQLNSSIQITYSFYILLQMLHMQGKSKISLKLMPQKYWRISNLELPQDPGLDLEAFAKFSLLWMMEADYWTLMISDGDLSILVFNVQKKSVMNSLKNLTMTDLVKFIMLISLMKLEEPVTQKD